MAAQLAAMQIHLWVLTCVVGLLVLANILCNYRHARRDDGYRNMKRLWEVGKHTELLAYTSAHLQRAPASSMLLMYKAMALLALRRLDEAEIAAEALKSASPTMRHEALGLLDTIAEGRAGQG
jgi:hypothetical protein